MCGSETALVKANESLPESTEKRGPPANVPPTVTGIFTGNGTKRKALAFVSAHWQEPFSGKNGIALVFTEKDHSKEKKPDTPAMFGRFGRSSSRSMKMADLWFAGWCTARQRTRGFSSVGNIEATEFTYADGKVEGEISTNGPVETLATSGEVKIKFVRSAG